MESSSLRFGHVTEYDPSRHMARVEFPDMGIVSHWLPVLVSNSLKNHDETHLDIGEHVACMMAGEMGVILGAFYDDKNKPQVEDPDVRAVTFSDGVRVLYDRQRHMLVIDSPELVSVSAGTAAISADGIALSGNITLAGNITLSGSVSCPGYCRCGG
ncbi:MAG: phage baseplate assembly protein V [Synergistaceae bacterium]|nr:phage baseplate assembly protein V [Synergistaceae bacterium]